MKKDICNSIKMCYICTIEMMNKQSEPRTIENNIPAIRQNRLYLKVQNLPSMILTSWRVYFFAWFLSPLPGDRRDTRSYKRVGKSLNNCKIKSCSVLRLTTGPGYSKENCNSLRIRGVQSFLTGLISFLIQDSGNIPDKTRLSILK